MPNGTPVIHMRGRRRHRCELWGVVLELSLLDHVGGYGGEVSPVEVVCEIYYLEL